MFFNDSRTACLILTAAILSILVLIAWPSWPLDEYEGPSLRLPRFRAWLSASPAERPGRYALIVLTFVCSVVSAYLGIRDLIHSYYYRDLMHYPYATPHLAPADAPQVITTLIAVTTAVGTLIGVIATAFSKVMRARGDIAVQIRLADNDRIRAEAEMERARRGLEPLGDPAGPPAVEPNRTPEPDE
ncbi:hypothetical protein ABZ079_36340 [Streptomyces sp. NPDC006314]|uniref:hypothetical protein n=1 Tax=Streptomyces sp. NPDC006314 TaxID=3154475 RepID=UPI0033AED720